MCTARLFSQGSTSLQLKFTRQGRPPSAILGIRKLETLGYLVRSLVLTQYRSVTNGRTDGYAVAYTALAKLASWRAGKVRAYR